MTQLHKVLIGLGVVVVLFLAGRFIYKNVVVPWPYRYELRACLDAADNYPAQDLIDQMRDKCFRTYPHFL